jgi:hypothetical protein
MSKHRAPQIRLPWWMIAVEMIAWITVLAAFALLIIAG